MPMSSMLRTGDVVSRKKAKVFNWLKQQAAAGKVVSGQMSWNNITVESIKTKYGKYPGLRGFDWFAQSDPQLSTDILAWAAGGGLATICYHMPNPFYGNAAYNVAPAAGNWTNLVTEGTTENTNFKATLDAMAATLLTLQQNKAIVFLRPFHEMNGSWFWWGNSYNGGVTQAWAYMHNYFTKVKRLKNLLWVYSPNGGTGGMLDWYPGDQYVDVVGLDCYGYPTFEYGGELGDYDTLVSTGKPFAITEFGAGSPGGLPDGGVYMGPEFIASIPGGTLYWMNWESLYGNNFGLDQDAVGTLAIFADSRVLTRDEVVV